VTPFLIAEGAHICFRLFTVAIFSLPFGIGDSVRSFLNFPVTLFVTELDLFGGHRFKISTYINVNMLHNEYNN